MRDEQILTSVVVPLYNAENFISEAIKSIFESSANPIEIVVVNDKSTDQSVDRVLQFKDERVRLINGEGRGIAACMNTGLMSATGRVIMRCDADDLFQSDRINHQIELLQRHGEFGAVCGSFTTIDTRGRSIADMQCGDEEVEITDELKRGKVRTHFCSFAVRKEEVEKVGGFREFFETAEDIDFQLRLGECTRILYNPKIVYQYRLHQSSVTHSQKTAKLDHYEKLARTLQNQRQAGLPENLSKSFTEYSQHLPAPNFEVRAHMQGLLTASAWRAHRDGRKLRGLITMVRAVTCGPSNLDVWRNLLVMVWK